jgi:hypothetical protein
MKRTELKPNLVVPAAIRNVVFRLGDSGVGLHLSALEWDAVEGDSPVRVTAGIKAIVLSLSRVV